MKIGLYSVIIILPLDPRIKRKKFDINKKMNKLY